jgi:hypothetical protein
MLQKPVHPRSDGFLFDQAAFRGFVKFVCTERVTATNTLFSSEYSSPFLHLGAELCILKLILSVLKDYCLCEMKVVLFLSVFVPYCVRKKTNERQIGRNWFQMALTSNCRTLKKHFRSLSAYEKLLYQFGECLRCHLLSTSSDNT